MSEINLKQKIVKNIIYVASSSMVVKFVQIVNYFVLAKLLVPSDFGLVAIGSLFIQFLRSFQDGFGDALIYKKGNIKKNANTVFVLQLGVGLLFLIALYFVSPLIAIFYNDLTLVKVIRVLSITFMINSFSLVPAALLEKNLSFKKRVIPEVVTSLSSAIISISLALAGFGLWALIYSAVASSMINLIIIWHFSPLKPAINFDKNISRELFRYASYITLTGIIIFLATKTNDLIIGKMGIKELGFYTFAFTICNLPVNYITRFVNRVMFPAYSKLNHDKEKLGRAYLLTLRYISLVSVPLAAAIILIIPDFIRIELTKWISAIPLIYTLSIYGLIMSLSTFNEIFKGCGKPNYLTKYALLQLAIFLLLIFPAISIFGIMGAVIAFTSCLLFVAILGFNSILKLLNLQTSDLFNALKYQFLSALISTAILLCIKSILIITLFTLIFEAFLFIFVYLIILLIFNKMLLKEVGRLLNLL